MSCITTGWQDYGGFGPPSRRQAEVIHSPPRTATTRCDADLPATARSTTADERLANLDYFLERVVPVAEEAGIKLGLHPDDSLTRDGRGMPRIINSPGAYECVLDIADSQYNGITFCHGNFSAMDVDVPATIRRFTDRINFVHFRDVAGTPDNFTETWHDDGPTDMAAAIEAYRDIGFDESGRLYDRYRSSSRLRWADRERLASVVEGSIGVDLVRARPQGAVR